MGATRGSVHPGRDEQVDVSFLNLAIRTGPNSHGN